MSDSLLGSTALTPSVIQFNEIPYTWKVPGNYMEVVPLQNGNAVLPFPARGLVMGQMLSTGTAQPGVAYRYQNQSQIDTLFGRGSNAARMAAKFAKANTAALPFDVIGVADATGAVKAVNTITIGGAATAAGTLPFYFGDTRVPVPVNAGDTAAVVAANLNAAMLLQAQPGYKPLPYQVPSYTAGAAVVTATCAHGGTLGNLVSIRTCYNAGEVIPPGLTVTIAQTTAGATDPAASIASILAGISTWYTDVAFAWTDSTNIGVVGNWAIGRYGAMVGLDVQIYVGLTGTYGTELAFAPDCKFMSVLPMQNGVTPPSEYGASMAGACMVSSAQAPALQMKGVVLPDVLAPAPADVFTGQEQQQLLVAGHCTYFVDSSNAVYLQRVTTTFRSDPGGIADNNYFDLQDTKVPTRVRYDWDAYCTLTYPRNPLAQDGSIAAASMSGVVTPRRLKASWTSRTAVYERNGWIQNSAAMAAQSTFAIDPNDGNRVNSRQPIQIMGNLMMLAGQLQFQSNN